ncbi:ureidoglycolate lyase [Marinobacterium rhizophilum]|uniref:Ureidoglycolate lyase n=1 Tax=Marinobacterium rhizophilum TaxID=420402 RepID=A0ABY5HPX3_9GAMM|nr:ureidoglycolate lyase [Marinobacterium rhizophilum]UTW13220.1 ureidoglycolate lyase [Marinobacterium rhizophilum]
MKTLTLEPLQRDSFASFGEVIEMQGSHQFAINQGATVRYHDIARIMTAPQDGHAAISLARSQPLPSPLKVTMLERHPLASQAFIPQGQQPFIVIVAPPGETIDPADIRAFLCDGSQGINYHPGVWHHSLLALRPNQDFVLVDLITQASNCDEHHFEPGAQRSLDYSHLLEG